MAYVIAVCGSGGKTTLCKELAKKYANDNKKVCITTTTHMWFDDDVKKSLILGTDTSGLSEYITLDRFVKDNLLETGKVYYIANVDIDKELITPLANEGYEAISSRFDYIIVEADGSRSMPMKIPRKGEPVIPHNVNEIVVVVGMESIGREIGAVCHRFYEFCENDEYIKVNHIKADTIVTEELLDNFANYYYVSSLVEKFPDAKISIYKNTFGINSDNIVRKGIQRIAIVLCASGFSKRFGENKLLAHIDGDKKLYQVMIDKLIKSKRLVADRLLSNKEYSDIGIDIIVVSQYDEILNDAAYSNKVISIKNDKAFNGQSESIKLAVRYCKNNDKGIAYDAAIFVNADMPWLSEWELASFIYNSLLNNNGIAVMYTDRPSNPAYFEKKYFDEILKIDGDIGPKELFDKYKMQFYKYYISPKYLKDIDTKEDLEKLRERNID